MTYEERLLAIKASYDLIKKGGHVVVVETPNRLWYRDSHTSLENFFHWLPDKMAMDYAKFTSREYFNSAFNNRSDESLLSLARWGRGVSFHEFAIALGDAKKVKVASSMQSFLGYPEHRYKQLMKKIGPPGIDEGFYDEYLYIALSEP
jgi:S-adenosylmethionine-dependent methyltransferase